VDESLPAFVALPYQHRAQLILRLTAPEHPEQAGWVSLALFSNMAYDAAAHLPVAEAIAAGHPGLLAMGTEPPDPDGYWRFARSSYGRQLAQEHPDTIASGSLG
jgi:hypothetical protein